MVPRVLLIGGSLNQTSMMHAIAMHLTGCECWFTPFYAGGLVGAMSRRGMLDFTILGGHHRANTDRYLAQHRLPVDFAGRRGGYDLVLTGTDLIVQRNVRRSRLVLVQEGITEREGWLYFLVRYCGLPRVLADTAATGLSRAYDRFCVASAGYRELFVRKGADPDKIVVTGIPNFDNAVGYANNRFPHRGFVLVATSCRREVYKRDDRAAFLRRAVRIAAGRPLIFKLHPNEDVARATSEIRAVAPDAPVLTDGNVHEMIANCAMLIAQCSSVVFTGLALGKEVHSDLAPDELRRLAPVQNGGTSARRIANVCLGLLSQPPSMPSGIGVPLATAG